MHYEEWWFDSALFSHKVFIHFYVLAFNEEHVLPSFLVLLTQPSAH
jgi:hypothetical protein